jgi:hypothetical protein
MVAFGTQLSANLLVAVASLQLRDPSGATATAGVLAILAELLRRPE